MLETPSLYSARPALALDGDDLPEVAEGVLAIVVTETTDGLYQCESVIGNWGTQNGELGFVYSDRQTLDFGKELTITLGGGDRAGEIFRGKITGLEAHYPENRAPELAVLAEDRFQDLRMTRRTRTFEDVSDEDVIRDVAAGHGLTPDIDIDGPQYRILAQVNQSDLAFLRDRARAVDAEVWVHGDTLHAKARGRRDDGEISLVYGSNLREASVLADLAIQRTAVTVAGWDVASKEAISFEATGAAVQSELNGDDAGTSILEQAFGTRAESVVHTVPLTAAEAQARAESVMRTAARRFVTARGVAEGDARLRVGSFVELVGMGPGFGGRYYLTEVQHTFDGSAGYVTRFRAERPGLGSGS